MGWLYMNLAATGKQSPKQYLDAQFNWTHANENGSVTQHKVLRSAAKLGVYYAAVETSLRAASGEVALSGVMAVVCLTRYNLRATDGMTFGYKDMDETMGPNECDCPLAILDLLTPTDSEWANQWRERCRLRISKVMPKVGDVFTLTHPLNFRDGAQGLKSFRKESRGGRRVAFRSLENGQLYRISSLKDRELEVHPAEVAAKMCAESGGWAFRPVTALRA